YSKEEFHNLLRKNLILNSDDPVICRSSTIKTFHLARNPRSKRVTKLIVETETDKLILSGLDIRKTLKENNKILLSNYFYIETHNDSIIIFGRGAGHGCGMCQWGAIGMAQKGYSYNEILKHYYRGTNVKRKY
ncbi:hypothetical protein KAX75_12875, partial [candidate division WOR-3 bacterium]|nr:hypothetical protein [candidate division WOR-3 bacterium]